MGEMSYTTDLVIFQIVFCCTGSHTHRWGVCMVICGNLPFLVAQIISNPYLKSFYVIPSALPPFNCSRVAMWE